MIVAGIDIGSRQSKAVIMKGDEILSSGIRDTLPGIVDTAMTTMTEAMKGTGLSLENLQYVVATGYGRVVVPFANETVSEITCHAKGVNWCLPTVRTILEMGGQDFKTISLNAKGQVVNFIMNDKCAGGTGRFLEAIADAWEISLPEIGPLSLESTTSIQFSSTCVVFARSEALTMLSKGVPKSDILAGVMDSIAFRCHEALRRVGIRADFAVVGGVAKNIGMLKKLEEKVGIIPLLPDEPLLTGAIGAALLARKRLLVDSGEMR